ncbi:uncharacterized protein [Anolis sagrei]|uniref:uncharacterized protein n=1 Tax=Anolis sagrei TaxID=38937 RepID=UPI00351FF316
MVPWRRRIIEQNYNATWMERQGVEHPTPIEPNTLKMLWSLSVAIFSIGGMVSSFMVGVVSEWLGRKRAMIVNNGLAFLGGGFMGLAQLGKSYEMMIIGRFLIGAFSDQQLGHTVYRKPTHRDRDLHQNSNHHPSQKRSTIKALADRAKRICEPHLLQDELNHLNWALQANGDSTSDIRRAARPRTSHKSQDEDPPRGKVFLPYIKGTTDHIGKLMRKHNIQTIYKPTKKIQQITFRSCDNSSGLSLVVSLAT